MSKASKPLNRFLVKLTVVFLAASIGLYAGFARSNSNKINTNYQLNDN
jgi:preprotein translocase subunit SecG